MVGRLFLGGGGDEKQTFEIDRQFLEGVEKIFYIPIAWGNDNFSGCLHWFSKVMGQHKKVKIDMMIDWKRDINLRDYDAVYVGGGNTFKLLKRLRDGGYDRKLPEYYRQGGTIFGGSAGAIIWGKDIGIALICKGADVNEVGLRNTKGFNVMSGFDVQCHYENNQREEHFDYIERIGRDVIAIPEESVLLVGEGRPEVIGLKPITVFIGEKACEYKPGSRIKL